MPLKILLISQVYTPDPAAVARLMADAGAELAARGHDVHVLTAARGYDNPAVRYDSGRMPDGVMVTRLPFSSFGKRRMALRALAGLLFTLQAAMRALFMRNLDGVVVTTAPPVGSLAAVILSILRRTRVVYWPMDLNPDQTVALGLASPDSLMVRMLEWSNRAVLRRSSVVIALDRFMAARLEAKVPVAAKTRIIPPWPEEDDVEPISHAANPFRQQHGLEGKKVVMYSGTLGPSNPVDTLLDAITDLDANEQFVLMFVGGGTGMASVKARNQRNVVCLPYEPLPRMRYSLAAADVHIVSLGDSMVGIVHPCKVYGAMATSRPILFVGPPNSHVSEMLDEVDFGWHVRHGDVEGATRAFREIEAASAADLERKGQRAKTVVDRNRTKRVSCARVCDAIEQGLGGSR